MLPFITDRLLLYWMPTYSQGGVKSPTGGNPGCNGEPASASSIVEGGQQIR